MAMEGVDRTKAPAQRLAAFVAGQKAWKCTEPSAMSMGAAATEVCTTELLRRLTINVYSSASALTRAYNAERVALHAPQTGTGGCTATTFAGEQRWLHGEGEPGGRVFCFLTAASQSSRMVWMSMLGTPTLYDAQYASLDHRTLFFWWKNFSHEIF